MSKQSFRKKTRIVLTNMDLKFIQSEKNSRPHSSKHINSSTGLCIVCGGERSFDISRRRQEPFIGHHVSYYPQIIAFTHYNCHKKIHDIKNPIKDLIQYKQGDSEKYYQEKNLYFESNNSIIV